MIYKSDAVKATSLFPLPTLDEQADLVEKHRVDTLLFCPDSWALRHVFINQETGEVARARCNRWDCLYCGPRKVDQWRQSVKAAEPTLFITLTKAGHTVEEASRALTTFLQYLRRGLKVGGRTISGCGKRIRLNTLGCWNDIATLTRTAFDWHLLVSWPRFCGGGEVGIYYPTEREGHDAKGTTNVYERVQAGSGAAGADQRQEHHASRTRSGDRR